MPCIGNFYSDPVWVVRARRQYVFDENGRMYLDCYSGVGVVNCGHCNREIQEAAFEQAGKLDHTTTIYLTEPMIQLAERLAQITPGKLQKTFFCSSGSEANEGAALLATLHSGRTRFLAFDLGLHGRTLLTMNLTGLAMWRTDPSLTDRVTHVPTPNCLRCPYGKEYPSCELACAHDAAGRIEAGGAEEFAAFFAEPILGNGGVIVPPPGYFEILKSALSKHGILFIADEMQTGFGRTGRWFGVEHDGIQPDIMSVAKALANGIPIGAFIATERVAAAYTKPGASTFGGNGYSSSAALATLKFMEENELPRRADELGRQLWESLQELVDQYSRFAQVRGRGLMIGVEVVDSGGQEDPAFADDLLEEMRRRGFLLGKTGRERNVLTFMPPLIISSRDIEDIIENLSETLALGEGAP